MNRRLSELSLPRLSSLFAFLNSNNNPNNNMNLNLSKVAEIGHPTEKLSKEEESLVNFLANDDDNKGIRKITSIRNNPPKVANFLNPGVKKSSKKRKRSIVKEQLPNKAVKGRRYSKLETKLIHEISKATTNLEELSRLLVKRQEALGITDICVRDSKSLKAFQVRNGRKSDYQLSAEDKKIVCAFVKIADEYTVVAVVNDKGKHEVQLDQSKLKIKDAKLIAQDQLEKMLIQITETDDIKMIDKNLLFSLVKTCMFVKRSGNDFKKSISWRKLSLLRFKSAAYNTILLNYRKSM